MAFPSDLLMDAGGELRSDPGASLPAALWCIGINLEATRRNGKSSFPWLFWNQLCWCWRGEEGTRLEDKEGVTTIPGKIFGGGLNMKNLLGAITASPRLVQLLRTLLSSHTWLCSQRISAPSTLVSGKLQIKYRNKNTLFCLSSWIETLHVA